MRSGSPGQSRPVARGSGSRAPVAVQALDGRADTGSVMPLMLGLVAATLLLGLVLVQVGLTGTSRAEGQTAADAAALAAAKAMRTALVDAGTDQWDCADLVDQARDAAEDYAARNGGELRELTVENSAEHVCEVQVAVLSRDGSGGPVEVDDEAARGGLTYARAAAQGVGVEGLLGAAGRIRDFDWGMEEEPEEVAERIVAQAGRIDSMNYPYVLGGGHGQTPVPEGLPGYDCSSSVSKLLQDAGMRIPTMYTGAWVAEGRAEDNEFLQRGEGDFLTLWAYSREGCAGSDIGHVFAEIGGQGWGTSRSNPGGGPGWLPYAEPGGRFPCARPYHFPELEEELDAAFVAEVAPADVDVGGDEEARDFGAAGPRLIEPQL